MTAMKPNQQIPTLTTTKTDKPNTEEEESKKTTMHKRKASKSPVKSKSATKRKATTSRRKTTGNKKATPKQETKNNKKKNDTKAAPSPRPPRRVIPEKKDYIKELQPSILDVVSGRGGRSNHHAGNRPYWVKILQAREEYRDCKNDEAKGKIAQSIVDFIQKTGGRFLQFELTTQRWFLLPPKVVLDKVKQALRDKYVPLWARQRTENVRKDSKESAKKEECSNQNSTPDRATSSSRVVPGSLINIASDSTQDKDSKPAARIKPQSRQKQPQRRKPTTTKQPKKKAQTKPPRAKSITKKAPPAKKRSPPSVPYVARKPDNIDTPSQTESKPIQSAGVPGATPMVHNAAESYYCDELKEVIDRNIPSLAACSANDSENPYEFSFEHSLSMDVNYHHGDRGSSGGLGVNSFGGGNSPAAFGSHDTRSSEIVNGMIGQWGYAGSYDGNGGINALLNQSATNESHAGAGEPAAPSYWDNMFSDAIHQAPGGSV